MMLRLRLHDRRGDGGGGWRARFRGRGLGVAIGIALGVVGGVGVFEFRGALALQPSSSSKFAEPALPDADPLANVPIFPADNPWNTNIAAYPVHPNSTAYLTTIGLTRGLHADFGTVYNGAPNGIPFVVVPTGMPLV